MAQSLTHHQTAVRRLLEARDANANGHTKASLVLYEAALSWSLQSDTPAPNTVAECEQAIAAIAAGQPVVAPAPLPMIDWVVAAMRAGKAAVDAGDLEGARAAYQQAQHRLEHCEPHEALPRLRQGCVAMLAWIRRQSEKVAAPTETTKEDVAMFLASTRNRGRDEDVMAGKTPSEANVTDGRTL